MRQAQVLDEYLVYKLNDTLIHSGAAAAPLALALL
jgi:hypothetical protein